MDSAGINYGYLIVQLVNLSICLGWPTLSVYALFRLRQQKLNPTTPALWVLIILVVPLFGAIAYLVVKPAEESTLT